MDDLWSFWSLIYLLIFTQVYITRKSYYVWDRESIIEQSKIMKKILVIIQFENF